MLKIFSNPKRKPAILLGANSRFTRVSRDGERARVRCRMFHCGGRPLAECLLIAECKSPCHADSLCTSLSHNNTWNLSSGIIAKAVNVANFQAQVETVGRVPPLPRSARKLASQKRPLEGANTKPKDADTVCCGCCTFFARSAGQCSGRN